MGIPYEKESLEAGIVQLQEAIEMMQGEILKQQQQIAQYRVWIDELANDNKNRPNG